MTLPDDLRHLASESRLNVVCDFDGTIAPLVDTPDQARAIPGSLEALSALAELDGTAVALLSGRPLATLAKLTGEPPGVTLIGSHGAEIDGVPVRPDRRLAKACADFQSLGRRYPGSRIELKPAGTAFHYRTVGLSDQPAAGDDAEKIAARYPDLELIHGKHVVELVVPGGGKGRAIDSFRIANPGPVLFIGDDVTDEQGFAVLTDRDVGVKVGEGDTRAGHRVDSAKDVVALLEFLLAQRKRR